jgi:hypothetical protein
MTVESALAVEYSTPIIARGYDLTAAPKTITTRLVLNPGKTQVLAQAIYISEPLVAKAAK